MEEAKIASAEENAKIAKLTADAIKASNEKVCEDIKRTIETIESHTAMLRLEADNLVMEMRKHTSTFADRVTSFVENCHGAMMMIRGHQARLGDMPNGKMDFDQLIEESKTYKATQEVIDVLRLSKDGLNGSNVK